MKFRAPAKLILSGEHAVVHGAPALAMAVDSYVTVDVAPQTAAAVTVIIPEFNYRRTLDAAALEEVRERVQQHYKLFLQNKININQVLQHPAELIEYTLSVILPTYRIQQGMQLTYTTTIPVGCGMGSSAAAIVSTLYAVTTLAGYQLPVQEIYPLALTAENMQHGHSSGVDVHLALRGGCLYRQGDQLTSRDFTAMPVYLVQTGAPVTSTGECVAAVRPYFTGERASLTDDFATVTNALDQAWQANDVNAATSAIRVNHQLLTQIGVVPERVQQFIAKVEEAGGAAKICGAGAVGGECAGVVLVLSKTPDQLTALCRDYEYSLAPIKGVDRGVHEF